MRISDWSSDVCSSDLASATTARSPWLSIVIVMAGNPSPVGSQGLGQRQAIRAAAANVAQAIEQRLGEMDAETADRPLVQIGVEIWYGRAGGGVESGAAAGNLHHQLVRLPSHAHHDQSTIPP